ncbi:MAG: hypothetical protein R3A10_07055 [Caldilineaceae bacterium]
MPESHFALFVHGLNEPKIGMRRPSSTAGPATAAGSDTALYAKQRLGNDAWASVVFPMPQPRRDGARGEAGHGSL